MRTVLCFWLGIFWSHASAADLDLSRIHLPVGFSISVYAKDIPGARSLTWGKNGILFVGSRDQGKVYAVVPDGTVKVIAKKLNSPNGVAFKDGALFVAEIHRIIRFDNIEQNLDHPPEPRVIAEYPKDAHHGWKFIAFGPDNRLYVPVGAPCNVCEVKDLYGTLSSITAEGKDRRIVASGIRNTVGFDWHPSTRELWFTENGRDQMGDDLPADELNHLKRPGANFGFPFCHQGDLLDPEFGKKRSCSDYEAPAKKLGPHVAALGMRFYTGQTFPKMYRSRIFIAEHGSWNRSMPLGYRVMTVQLDEKGKTLNYEVFAQGWLQGRKAWGRPVDVINAPDGSLLVSDDEADVIYKIRYSGK